MRLVSRFSSAELTNVKKKTEKLYPWTATTPAIPFSAHDAELDPVRFENPRGNNPLSPSKKTKASTPTSGGKTIGIETSALQAFLPRNSNVLRRKAKGTPMSAARMTERQETRTLFHVARRFAGEVNEKNLP
jgi:hypothetical protein